MKKKLLLITVLVALFVCLFAVAVSAAETDEIPEWPAATTILEGMSDKATFGADGRVGATSRVLMSDGKAYPAYYIFSDKDSISISFTDINKKGVTYSKASIVRLEVPNGIVTAGQTCINTSGGYTGIKTIVLPETLTTIGAGAFKITTLVSINLPESLTSMANNVFNGCTSLKAITIPSNLETISETTFQSCTALETVDFSNAKSLKTIGSRAFYKTSALKKAILPEGLTTLNALVFYNSGVEEVYLPSTLVTISSGTDSPFSGCTSIKIINSKAPVIVANMFNGCTALETLNLENTVSIGSTAFYNTTSLESAILPEGLKTIGYQAFKLSGVKEVYLPSTLVYENVDTYVFAECSRLQKVTSKSTFIADYMFHNPLALTELYLENTVKIGTYAFYCNKVQGSLESVDFPSTLTEIGSFAFAYAKFEKIIIPASVTEIGNDAFKENPSLKTAVILGSTMGEKMFLNCSNMTRLVITENFTTFGSSALNGVNQNSFTTFYTGKNNDFDTIKGIITLNRVSSAMPSSYESYKAGTHTQNKYIFIYGANLCDVAYESHNIEAEEGNTCCGVCTRCGEKAMYSDPKHTYYMVCNDNGAVSLLDIITVKEVCQFCNTEGNEEELAPILETYGVSSSLTDVGVYQKTKVNKDSIARYAEVTGNKDVYNYGIFAGVAKDTDGTVYGGDLITLNGKNVTAANPEKTVVASFANTEYTFLTIKITGVASSDQIYYGAFAVVGTKVTYVTGNEESDAAQVQTIA